MRRFSDGYFRPDRETVLQSYLPQLPQEMIQCYRNLTTTDLEHQIQPPSQQIFPYQIVRQNHYIVQRNGIYNNPNQDSKIMFVIVLALLFFVGVGYMDC